MAHEWNNPVAKAIPYDDTLVSPPLNADEAQAAIDALKVLVAISASPGFTWGRSGTVNPNTWLLNDSVPSNNSGRTIFLLNAQIMKIFVANQAPTAGINIGIYSHDGNSVNLSLLGSVTTAALRSNTFNVAYNVALNKQIAIKVAAGSSTGQNMVVGCLIKGTLS